MNTPGANSFARWFILLFVLSMCVGCDQVTKQIARENLEGRPPLTYLSDTVRLVYAENPGAFLGLGGGLPPRTRWLLLVVVNALVSLTIGLLLVFSPKLTPLKVFACALLLSGAIGNLIDRVRFDGLVIDFMNVGIGPLRTGIFNVADVAISLGALLLILPQFLPAKPENTQAEGV
jgi:signal peptidase II